MKRDCCGMLFDWLVERGLIGHVPRLQKALLGHGTKMLLMMAKMWEPGIRQLLMEEAKRKQSIWFGVICLSRLHPDAQMRCVSSWCVAFQLLGKVFLFAAGGGAFTGDVRLRAAISGPAGIGISGGCVHIC